jgi:predicted nucleotidyltransferase
MGATSPGLLLFGKTRRAVLALLFGRPDESFYLRQIARFAQTGQGAVQRELAKLAEAGIIHRIARGRQVSYRVNRESPVFADLQRLVMKTVGVADVLRAALTPLEGQIDVAFVFGSLARGGHGRRSDVDLLVVGAATFAEVVAALQPAQEKLGREVNPSVYPRAEFRKKLAEGHPFLHTVLREAKIFLIGTGNELAAVAGQRVAAGA